MAINFPTSLDSFANPVSWPRNQAWQVETEIIANLNDSVEAIEGYLWVVTETDESTITGKVKKVDKLTTKGDILVRNDTWYDRLAVWANWYQLVADSTEATGLKYIPATAWGTVTSVSIVTANGLAWTVATATTTPAITLTTSVTGLLKGNWTAISAASAGTDYYAPAWTDIAVADWGTWRSSHTAYALIAWWTTSTSAQQSLVWVGTTWQILKSNGAWALPTFQSESTGTLANSVTEATFASSTTYNVLATATVPWGFLNGNWIKIEAVLIIRSFWLGDSRDDVWIKLTYWGVNQASFFVRPWAGDYMVKIEATILGTWGSAQRSRLLALGSYTVISTLASGTVDSTADRTITLEWANGFNNAFVYIKHQSSRIFKI